MLVFTAIMLATVWAAGSTALSACIYLLDLGSTISVLITYYRYEYLCPNARFSSPLLRDPICHAARLFRHSAHASRAFWACLYFLAQAHLAYAFMFWISLDPRKHPLRLAYFMPLIHLYRLLKLLRHSFSSQGLKDLKKSQEESSSLYSALGVSLETVPQLIVQSCAVWNLGQYPSDPYMQAQRIPTNLILSLVASMVSCVYNASMAVWFLNKKHPVSLARRAFVATMAGCQTFVVMLAKAVFATTLSEGDGGFFPIVYLLFGVLVAWPFIGLLLQSHCESQGKSKFLVIVHSLGFALMTTYTGPIYVMVKLGQSARNLIWGTLLHIFVELISLTLVFALPSAFRKNKSPCQSSLDNKYLTCKVFLGTIFPSFFVLLLTSILFAWVHGQGNKNTRDISEDTVCYKNARDTFEGPKDIVSYSPKASSSNISTLTSVDMQLSKTFEDTTSRQRSIHNLKKLYLLVMLTILFVQKLQK